uniref:Transposase DDE domain-containing protein n=1 Tax=Candidatus Kentrum eta TaxID=2126337 RepID=A0A450VSY6_9GAMM|nr:MAG: Transposase DDE domain-containing protein [Candidatus Kentron sp. H]
MDKAYDCDKLIEQSKGRGIISVIPSKANRKELREYDKRVYKEHHLVECFNGKLKQFRRVFSRFEKLHEFCTLCRRFHMTQLKCQHSLRFFSPTSFAYSS